MTSQVDPHPAPIAAFLERLSAEIGDDPEVARQIEEFRDFLEARGAGRQRARAVERIEALDRAIAAIEMLAALEAQFAEAAAGYSKET